ncbi:MULTISPECIES: hypothetical protein [unclassified Bradyrhizobium]|uniref:hypothetical protein n=1 Tax=unclassified Bradyrhizobium TaxID=2631580 RepID=UPI0033993780
MSANDKDFNRLRAQFSRRANAREVPALASKLCWWIAYGHMDSKRHTAFVTQKTLANDLGDVAVRSVQRMIDVLKPLGLNVAPGHGPDKASTYWIGEAKTTSMSPIETDNTTSMSPIEPGQGDITGTNRRHFKRRKATLVSRHIKNSKKISKKVSNKSAPMARSSADDVRDSASYSTSVDEPLSPAFSTVDDAPCREPDGPVPRPVGRPETVKAQQPPAPERVEIEMGRPADDARAAFADASYPWPTDRTDEGAYAAYVAALDAAQGNTEAIINAVWERLEESGADPPWLSEALRRIERDLRKRTSRE